MFADTAIPNANPVSKLISPNITHQYVAVDDPADKPFIISELIASIRSDPRHNKLYNPAVLVFVGKDSSPIALAEALSEHDLKSALLHEYVNDKSLRSEFLKLFKNGRMDAVIATESISRGLDFVWLDHLIVAEVPAQDTSYLHMAGRCSRLGSRGFVTSVVDEHEEDRLKRHCFKYQIQLEAMDDPTKLDKLKRQKRKYNKLSTFPLLLENREYHRKLKKQLMIEKYGKEKSVGADEETL